MRFSKDWPWELRQVELRMHARHIEIQRQRHHINCVLLSQVGKR
jgi:hypothetical protein